MKKVKPYVLAWITWIRVHVQNWQSLLKWRTLVIFGLAISVSSCLDIEEEISLNSDGSGSYRMSVDMAEMMSMLQSFMGEVGQGSEVFDSMDSTLQAQVATLRQIDGLSNVGHQAENYAFTISYDFANVEALNQASNQGDGLSGMQALGLPEGGAGSDETTGPAYSWTPKTFARTNIPLEDAFSELGEDEETESAMEMAKMMMADASYKIVYSFPGKVKKFTNSNATLSADKKTLTLNLGMLDILEGKAEMGNNVKFKRR